LSNINVTKQAINEKLPGSVAIYLRCSEVFNNQIKKGLLPSLSLKKNQFGEYLAKKRGCLVHSVRLANTLLKDEESPRDNHVLACKFVKYSPIQKIIDRLRNKPFLV